MRQIRAEIGSVSKADGYINLNLFKAFNFTINLFIFHCEIRSAIFEMGNTKVIAAVYGPREVLYIII
jgi:hypothetical protein